MKNIVIALGVILLCVSIGSALGNQSGGFIVGVILAIVLAKKNWKADTKKSA
ncbi:hypothetical protein Asal01_01217 [Fodinibius salicampi]